MLLSGLGEAYDPLTGEGTLGKNYAYQMNGGISMFFRDEEFNPFVGHGANGICIDAWETYERLGSPEGELALAQAVVYLALAPKSNAGYVAYKAARAQAKQTGSAPPPKHILNAPTRLMKDEGYGSGYQYDHDAEDGFSGQNYFPDDVKRPVYYQPVERGFERELKKRVDFFAGLRAKRQG